MKINNNKGILHQNSAVSKGKGTIKIQYLVVEHQYQQCHMLECRGCKVEISVRVRSKIITIGRGADFLYPSFTNNSISWISFTDSASSSFLDTVDLPTLDQLSMTLFVSQSHPISNSVIELGSIELVSTWPACGQTEGAMAATAWTSRTRMFHVP